MHNRLKTHVRKILQSDCTVSKYYRNRSLPNIKFFKQIDNMNDYNIITKSRYIGISYFSKCVFFLSKILLTNDLSQIQEMYHGWTNGITIYISDQLDDVKIEETIVHELAHCLENEQQNLRKFIKDDKEYALCDEVYARVAEFEYRNPKRRITRSITNEIRRSQVSDDYYND
jgi:hypothetical protein